MHRRCPNALLGLKRGADSEFAVFFMLVAPGHHKLSLWEMIRAGLLMMIVHFGTASCLRLLAVNSYVEQHDARFVSQAIPEGRFWHLQRMVVLPKHQGQGLGSRCLSAALKEL